MGNVYQREKEKGMWMFSKLLPRREESVPRQFVNSGLYHVFGLTERDVVGLKTYEESEPEFWENWDEILKKGSFIDQWGQRFVLHWDGSEVWLVMLTEEEARARDQG